MTTNTPDIFFSEGDSLPILEAVLRDGDGDPVDLTGATVVFRIRRADADLPAVDRACTVDPDQVANPGKVTCQVFDEGDAVAGLYRGRFKVTASGEQLSFLNDRLLTIAVDADP